MKEIFEFLARGGIVMIPIALGSVIALTLFLERMWSLQQSRIIPRTLLPKVLDAVRGKKQKTAREECLKSNTPLGNVLLMGLDSAKQPRSEIKVAVEEIGSREVSYMERYIEAIGTIASVEPLLGLLGTVIGMIGVFQKVVINSRQGAVDPSQLANGIWQALITTAAGMTVAIIALIGYRYLLSLCNKHSLDLEESARQLLEALRPMNDANDSDGE